MDHYAGIDVSLEAVVQIPRMAAKLGSGVHWDQAASTAFQISDAVLPVVLSLLSAN